MSDELMRYGAERIIGIIKRDALYNPEAASMAISALEKEVPKDVVEGYMFREPFRKQLKERGMEEVADKRGSCCPRCGKHVGESEEALQRANYFPYCKWCGQALKGGF